MKKSYIICINGIQHFLFTTDENAKVKRLLARRMIMDDRTKNMSTMQIGVFLELKEITLPNNAIAFKNTNREALVWLSNAVTVSWEEAVWNNELQAWQLASDVWLEPIENVDADEES